jgi:methyltransferase (TIGR00027 family)
MMPTDQPARTENLLRAGQPSRSALMVARLRAAHQLLDEPAIFADPLALSILGAEDEAQVRGNLPSYCSGFARIVRTAMAVRSRLAEDELAAAQRRGCTQYVVLGAGLDTFGCRNRHDQLSVFEVDHPATQAWKRGLLKQSYIPVPSNLHFAPVDFEHDTLADALHAAGCDLTQPIFFSWLGVTLYLTEAAIFDTFRFVAQLPKGSAIVFDYGVQPELLGPMERMGVEHFARKYAEQGEPWLSFFDPEILAARMAEMGFDHIADFGPAQLEQRYFSGRSDGLRMAGGTHLMLASN